MPMPPMLAYTIRSSYADHDVPRIVIDAGKKKKEIFPANPKPASYWFVFLDVNNPKVSAKEYVVPGLQHATVPPGLEADMSNPSYIFAVATQSLPIPWIPQGALYDLLSKFGASRELQKLEQFNATIPCGGFNSLSYVFTSLGGPRTPPNPAPASYELGRTDMIPAVLMMSLMAQANGQGPYSIMDSYTWTSP
jgi:hypothetical protein